MKVLVTGGAGFIGSHLVERLLGRGDQVAALDNFNSFYDPEIKRRNLASLGGRKGFSLYETDILDLPALEQIFRREKPEAVAHLAAWAGVRPSLEKPQVYSEANVTGTINLLELSRKYSVANFVFASSSSVYGINSKLPFSEDDPIATPISPYAATKRAAELICHVYAHNYKIPITCLRLFTVYGPRQRPEMAIHKFTRLICEEKPVPVYGDGTSLRDYTYVDDIIDGMISSLERPFQFEIINLGDSKTVPLSYLITLIEKEAGKKARVEHLPPQPGDVPATYADISKASRLLNYSPRVQIEEGVRRFVRWYLSGQEPEKGARS